MLSTHWKMYIWSPNLAYRFLVNSVKWSFKNFLGIGLRPSQIYQGDPPTPHSTYTHNTD